MYCLLPKSSRELRQPRKHGPQTVNDTWRTRHLCILYTPGSHLDNRSPAHIWSHLYRGRNQCLLPSVTMSSNTPHKNYLTMQWEAGLLSAAMPITSTHSVHTQDQEMTAVSWLQRGHRRLALLCNTALLYTAEPQASRCLLLCLCHLVIEQDEVFQGEWRH
jgi:hypothetical protein